MCTCGMNSVGSAHSFQIFPKPVATQTGAPRGLQMAHIFLLNHPTLDDESPLSIPPPPGKSRLESWNLKRPAVNVGRLLLQWIIIRSTFFVINTSSCLFCCKLICISFKNMILSENERLWTIHVYVPRNLQSLQTNSSFGLSQCGVGLKKTVPKSTG